MSFVKLLEGGRRDRGPILWHYPHYGNQGGAPAGAVREGRWKLIEWYETGDVELYERASDRGEGADLARRMPERARELRGRLQRWRRRVGAEMPAPNPGWKQR